MTTPQPIRATAPPTMTARKLRAALSILFPSLFLGVFIFLLLALPTLAVNLVPNSSFEAGSGRGWQFTDHATNLKDKIATAGGAAHGTHYFPLGDTGNLITAPIWMTAVQHTISQHEKANEANTFRYEIWKLGDGPGFGTGAWVNAPTSWTRRSFNFTPPEANYYQIGYWHLQPTMALQVDAIQVEVGATATAYAPMATVEVGLETSVVGNAFFDGDTKQVSLRWWNDGGATTGTAYYEIFDLWNRRIANGFSTTALASGATTTTISLPSTNGWQRITTRIPETAKSWDELTVAVFPFAAQSGVSATGILGTHTTADATQVALLRRVGFSWNRIFSPVTAFRWSVTEATEDVYVWQDAAVTACTSNGMSGIGVLGAGLDSAPPPAWALNGDDSIKLDKWSDFVTDVVAHYKDRVKIWEVWNEPHQGAYTWLNNATNYGRVLAAAAAAIKAEDPTATVVGMAGVYDEEWAEDVWDTLSAGEKAQVDIISCHLYPPDNSYQDTDQNVSEFDSRPNEWKLKAIGTRPIWNTETGSWAWGGMLTENNVWAFGFVGDWSSVEWQRSEGMLRSKVQVDRVIRNLLRCLGNGFARYFYYDSREWSHGNVKLVNSGASSNSTWEYTESLRPNAIALAIARHFLDGYTAHVKVTNVGAAGFECYLFTTPTAKVAAVSNYDRVNRQLSVSETAFVVYDVMGNAVTQPANKINITRTPQYIVSPSLSVGAMTTMLEGSLAGLADTVAPNISVDIAPSGVWGGGAATLKFSAIDETNVNSVLQPDNIDFRWQTDGGAFSSWGQIHYVQPTLGAGNHTLTIQARDVAGNTAEMNYEFSPALSVRKILRLVP